MKQQDIQKINDVFKWAKIVADTLSYKNLDLCRDNDYAKYAAMGSLLDSIENLKKAVDICQENNLALDFIFQEIYDLERENNSIRLEQRHNFNE